MADVFVGFDGLHGTNDGGAVAVTFVGLYREEDAAAGGDDVFFMNTIDAIGKQQQPFTALRLGGVLTE